MASVLAVVVTLAFFQDRLAQWTDRRHKSEIGKSDEDVQITDCANSNISAVGQNIVNGVPGTAFCPKCRQIVPTHGDGLFIPHGHELDEDIVG